MPDWFQMIEFHSAVRMAWLWILYQSLNTQSSQAFTIMSILNYQFGWIFHSRDPIENNVPMIKSIFQLYFIIYLIATS